MCWLWPSGHLSLPSWVPGVGELGAHVHPALAPATALGIRQDRPEGTASPHGLRAQTSRKEGVRQNPGLVLSSDMTTCPSEPPRHICAQLLPLAWAPPDLNFIFARKMSCVPARACTLDSLLKLPEVPSILRATLLHKAPPDRQLAPLGAKIEMLPGPLGTGLSWAGPQCPRLDPKAFGFVGRSVCPFMPCLLQKGFLRDLGWGATALCDMSQVLRHTV